MSFITLKHKKEFSTILMLALLIACQPQTDPPKSSGPKATTTQPKAIPHRKLPQPSTNINLPSPVGRFGEVVVVADSSTYKSQAGQALIGTLRQPLDYLLSPEPMFKVQINPPEALPDVLKRHRNIIYLVNWNAQTRGDLIINKLFTPESRQKLQQKNQFMLIQKEKYARDQTIIYLMGKNTEDLAGKITTNGLGFANHLWDLERNRMTAELLSDRKTRPEVKMLAKTGVGVALPDDYEKVALESNFAWYRKMTDMSDVNFVLTHRPYFSETQLTKEYFTKWIDSLGTARISGSGKENDKSTALIIEKLHPVQKTNTAVEDQYIAYFKGAWKLSDFTRGGHFLAFVMPDTKTNKIYLAFGFFYAAGLDKRYFVKEIESLLYTIDHAGIRK